VQITNNGRGNGAPMLTDGARLFFNLAGDPSQILLRGGDPVPLSIPLERGRIVDLSPDGSEFLLVRQLHPGQWARDFDTMGRIVLEHELWVAPVIGGSATRLGKLVATQNCCLGSGIGQYEPHRLGDNTSAPECDRLVTQRSAVGISARERIASGA
jgi:hypothetical protein